jgi:hypothetical protein
MGARSEHREAGGRRAKTDFCNPALAQPRDIRNNRHLAFFFPLKPGALRLIFLRCRAANAIDRLAARTNNNWVL